MTADVQAAEGRNSWELLEERLNSDLEETQQKVREITLLLQQSKIEVDRLAQRNTSITSHLQQILAQVNSTPPEELRKAYDEALDAQQRLVLVRGQAEKLESEKGHLERYLETLRTMREAFDGGTSPGGSHSAKSPVSAEMMVEAQESERHRLSRKMHDGPAQSLSNFILLTEIALRLFDMDQDKAREELINLKATASSTFQQVRDFIFDLRPMMLDDLGLVPTAKRYADAFREKSGVDVSVTATGPDRRLEPYIEVMLFRAIQELLNNAVVHGQAGVIKVQIDMSDSGARVSVEDDGKGFDVEAATQEADKGIKLIKDRVEMTGGEFTIESTSGKGTRVALNVPANAPSGFA